jgi:hypothetical protein
MVMPEDGLLLPNGRIQPPISMLPRSWANHHSYLCELTIAIIHDALASPESVAESSANHYEARFMFVGPGMDIGRAKSRPPSYTSLIVDENPRDALGPESHPISSGDASTRFVRRMRSVGRFEQDRLIDFYPRVQNPLVEWYLAIWGMFSKSNSICQQS